MLDIVLCGLAAFRLAYLFVNEAGPFDIVVNFRRWVGFEPEEGVLTPEWVIWKPRNAVGKMLECVYCTGMWTALLSMMMYYSAFRPVVYWLVISAAVMLIHRWHETT